MLGRNDYEVEVTTSADMISDSFSVQFFSSELTGRSSAVNSNRGGAERIRGVFHILRKTNNTRRVEGVRDLG